MYIKHSGRHYGKLKKTQKLKTKKTKKTQTQILQYGLSPQASVALGDNVLNAYRHIKAQDFGSSAGAEVPFSRTEDSHSPGTPVVTSH